VISFSELRSILEPCNIEKKTQKNPESYSLLLSSLKPFTARVKVYDEVLNYMKAAE
jgi:hypothetical protein